MKKETGTAYRDFIQRSSSKTPLGRGVEKTVFPHPTHGGKVVAVFHPSEHFYQTVRRLKARFYLNKILHLLFPENIPDIHLAASQPPSLILERVSGGRALENKLTAFFWLIQIVRFQLACDRVGVRIDDGNDKHFHKGRDFAAQYVDGFSIIKQGLEKAIQERLVGEERERALRYRERLRLYE